jgi:YHS domain-containing protein
LNTSLRRILPLTAAFAVATLSSTYAGEIFTTEGVAIHGYDPVAYFVDHKPVKGIQSFTASYQGATFYFASAAHRDVFKSDPARYSPQYGGYCALGTAAGHKAPTEPQAFTVTDGKLYLNYNDDVMKTWRKDVPGYIAKADALWSDVKKQPNP